MNANKILLRRSIYPYINEQKRDIPTMIIIEIR